MATNWKRCAELAGVAQELIEEPGSAHEHLGGVRIEYLKRDDTPRSGDRAQVGGVQKVSGMNAFLGSPGEDSEPFFAVWVPTWVLRTYGKDAAQFRGLVDHLLCHLFAGEDEEGEVKISKRSPEFAGFRGNVERHGLWWGDAREMFEAMRSGWQLQLPLAGGAVVHGTGSLEPGDLDRPGTPLADLVAAQETASGDEDDGADDGFREMAADALTDGKPELLVVNGGAPKADPPGVVLQCGHWMASDEIRAGKTCPNCAVQDGLKAVAVEDEESAAKDTAAWENFRKAKRKKRVRGEVPAVGDAAAGS